MPQMPSPTLPMHMADYEKGFSLTFDDERNACTIRFRCFDTPNAISVFVDGWHYADVEDLLIRLYRTCLEYHFLWSFSLPQSDVSRLNRPCDSVEVDERTARLLKAMKSFHDIEPSFDFTVGPVSYLWKHIDKLPTKQAVAEALSHVGANKISIDGRTVYKLDPLVQVDVGGGAKGFVADELARMVRKAGVQSADIDLGGNLFMLGHHPAGRPWRVSVRIPEGLAHAPIILEVSNSSVVTSGSYERFAKVDGKRYQHIVDARTGWPAETDIVSATVVSPSSLEADLLATTALLAGSAGIDALRARHPGCTFVVF